MHQFINTLCKTECMISISVCKDRENRLDEFIKRYNKLFWGIMPLFYVRKLMKRTYSICFIKK